MEWRVHLDKAPRRRLDYYYLRSSFNHEDIENLQNVEERTLHTPQGVSFDNQISVQLVVAEDGTARPRFVYKKGRNGEELESVAGKPFYLDMTYGKSNVGGRAYIGFDFGTSNSSLSYVS